MRRIEMIRGCYHIQLTPKECDILEQLLRSGSDNKGTERRVKQRRIRSGDRRDMETRLFRDGGDSKEYGRRFGRVDRRG